MCCGYCLEDQFEIYSGCCGAGVYKLSLFSNAYSTSGVPLYCSACGKQCFSFIYKPKFLGEDKDEF